MARVCGLVSDQATIGRRVARSGKSSIEIQDLRRVAMAQSTALVRALKDVLKARGITYARLAKGLRLSEASVKRVFAQQSFTLERLDRICGFLGIEISDLARIVADEGESPVRLTWEQEKEVVSDPKLLLVAVHALNHWTFDEIASTYTLSKAE